MNADIFCLIAFATVIMIPFYYLTQADKRPDDGPATEIDWWVPYEHFFGEDE